MLAATRLGLALLLLTPASAAFAGKRAQQIAVYPSGTVDAYCLALDSNEDIWVTHAYAGYVERINEDSLQRTTIASGFPSLTALGIAIDSEDNVYFSGGGELWKRDPEGTQCDPPLDMSPCLRKVVSTELHGIADPAWPVYVDLANNAYIAGRIVDTQTHQVFKVSPDGQVTTLFAPPNLPVLGQYEFLKDLAIEASGTVFVSEYKPSGGKVHRIPTSGPIQAITPGVNYIDGIEVDSDGNLWVAGRSVLKLTPTEPDFSDWDTKDLTPPTSSFDAKNTYMTKPGVWSGGGNELYTTGLIGGAWKITDEEPDPVYELLLDPSTSSPPFDYGLDVIENKRGYLYLTTEHFIPSNADASVWRICENLDTDIRCDDRDNCLEVDNAAKGVPLSQYDADHDGYGSRCDADFDQDSASGLTDFGIFKACFGKLVDENVGPPADPDCAESDLNGDGGVGIADYGIFGSLYGNPVGPSGLGCALSPPVDDSCTP
jgi:hypothetical protein